ncbi:uncharacterized protein LOC131167447 [Malania oleifera]|uniref:uncharacterized protein LOC131167447 n=1 Tax=Malania oleifera TaxID=397392 RepID=UPI0025ADF2F0|nr:uncharacterized protein LOC131167447 [Malania oleifera]
MRFEKKGKLNPRYTRPFKILERIGPVAYRVALPLTLSRVHDVFHMSVLRKYIPDLSHVISYEFLEVGDTLSNKEIPIQILDRKIQELCTKEIPLVKVLWRNHAGEDASWELETEIHQKYPHIFREAQRYTGLCNSTVESRVLYDG